LQAGHSGGALPATLSLMQAYELRKNEQRIMNNEKQSQKQNTATIARSYALCGNA
jgi:hypothetical protein